MKVRWSTSREMNIDGKDKLAVQRAAQQAHAAEAAKRVS